MRGDLEAHVNLSGFFGIRLQTPGDSGSRRFPREPGKLGNYDSAKRPTDCLNTNFEVENHQMRKSGLQPRDLALCTGVLVDDQSSTD